MLLNELISLHHQLANFKLDPSQITYWEKALKSAQILQCQGYLTISQRAKIRRTIYKQIRLQIKKELDNAKSA